VVGHRCDERLCTAEEHLQVGTFADNSWDAMAPPIGQRSSIRGAALAGAALSAKRSSQFLPWVSRTRLPSERPRAQRCSKASLTRVS
jgi:hypothetical protein